MKLCHRCGEARADFCEYCMVRLKKKVTKLEKREQHKAQELGFLLQLEAQAGERRAMEPKHSREDHECEECEVLAELRVLRRSQKT